jgi:hypothetical protein
MAAMETRGIMGAARPETARKSNPEIAWLLERIFGLGHWRFAVLFTLFFFSPYWLVINLVEILSWHPPGLVSKDGINIGRDFVAFYSAASLTMNGEAASAYDHVAIHAAQGEAIGAPVKFFPWFYPPTMLMFIAPLALMHYFVALAIWCVAPLVSLMIVVKRYVGHAWAAAAALLFPGTAHSLLTGQNGVLSALIIAAGVLNLERRPVLAGAILGALSYKPHVAAAVYAALLIGRYWHALAASIAVALALALMSVILLGTEPWVAFLRETHVARTFLEGGQLPWVFMATMFATARLAGLDSNVAYVLQAVVTCGALVSLFVVWRRRDIPLELRAAVLVTVIPLTTPYAFSYDLAVIVIALVWLARTGFETGFRRDELIVFALAWVASPLGWVLADTSGVLLLTPIVLVALLAVLMRRILGGNAGMSELPEQAVREGALRSSQ